VFGYSQLDAPGSGLLCSACSVCTWQVSTEKRLLSWLFRFLAVQLQHTVMHITQITIKQLTLLCLRIIRNRQICTARWLCSIITDNELETNPDALGCWNGRLVSAHHLWPHYTFTATSCLVIMRLTGRVQYCKVNDTLSTPRNINLSMVQGSSLGPSLYVIMECDLQPQS